METKDQFHKILQWMKQINKAVESLQDNQISMEKRLTMRIDGIDERFDSLSEAVQALLKTLRGLRIEQFNDRTRFTKEIHKIREEIQELIH